MKSWQEGSYTIEAAVIMTLIIALVSMLIYTAICLHDRAVCLETALFDLRASVGLMEEPVTLTGRLDAERIELHSVFSSGIPEGAVSEFLLENEFKLKAENRMLMGKLTWVKAEIENGSITLNYEGRFSFMDGGFAGILSGPEKTFSRKVTLKKGPAPEEIVRVMKGLIWRN